MSDGLRNRKPEPKSPKSTPSTLAPPAAAKTSRRRWIYAVLFLALLLLGPFAIPDPNNPTDRSERELADPDSKFIDLLGYTIHYKERESTAPREAQKSTPLTVILLHGFSSNVYSFRKIMDPLAEMGRVIAFDRIGQGLSAHPTVAEFPPGEISPYAPSMQPKFIFALMDKLNIDKAILVGNSNGGGQALRAALENPDRVLAVVSASSDWYTTGIMPSGRYSWLWNTPQMRCIGTWLAAKLLGPSNAENLIKLGYADPSRLSAAETAQAVKYLHVRNFGQSLWEYAAANEVNTLPERVKHLSIPLLAVAGDKDQVISFQDSQLLAKTVKRGQFVLLEDCGHLPQEEKPNEMFQAIRSFAENAVLNRHQDM